MRRILTSVLGHALPVMTLGIVLLTICDEQAIALVGSLAVRDDASVRLGDGWGYASTDHRW
jgi:hypothetical protein